MIASNLKFAIRNLRKYKVFSFINLFGLIIGITASLLIFMYVVNELSFENVQNNADRIYRINVGFGSGDSQMKMAGAMPAIGPASASEIPGVEAQTRFLPAENIVVKYGDKQFKESKFYYADTSFFNVFSFQVVRGNRDGLLYDPYSVVITESIATKIFDGENPVGKTLKCGDNDLIVKAVVKDIPVNTQIQCDYVAPFSLYEKTNDAANDWYHFGQCFTYLLMQKNFKSDLSGMINKLYAEKAGKETAAFVKLYPQKFTDIYLHSEVFGEPGPTGNITYIYLFSSVAVLILIVACFNFMNLSTARSMNRAREVGVKKVLGAERFSLVKQFLSESILVTSISVAVSAGIYQLLSPVVSDFLGYKLAVDSIYNLYFYLILAGITFITGIAAGIYPAFVLSGYKIADILKGVSKSGSSGAAVRKTLVVFQFSVSIFLIVATLSIFKQLDYMRNADLGFDKSNLLLINFPASAENGPANYKLLKDKLLQNTNIKDVSGVYTLPGVSSKEMQTVKLNSDDQNNKVVRAIGVDYDFMKTLGIHLDAGRNFSEQYAADKDQSVILNESAVKFLGLKNPIGSSLYIPGGNNGNKEVKVIGVVKDFHIASLKDVIDPYFLYINPSRFFTVAVKLASSQSAQTIDFIKSEWNKIYPNKQISYSFMDEEYRNLYSSEEKLAELFSIFSMLAILIGCLGLFGLSVFTAEIKTKEIGIRKTLGATVANISMMLSKQFVIWVLIANVFAWPFAGYAVNKWLENFAFRVGLDWKIFLISSIVVLFVSLIAISIQIIKAALANPINSLRYE